MPRIAHPTPSVPGVHVPRKTIMVVLAVALAAVAAITFIWVLDDDGGSGSTVAPQSVVRPSEPPLSSLDAKLRHNHGISAPAVPQSSVGRPVEGAAVQAMGGTPGSPRYDGGPNEGTAVASTSRTDPLESLGAAPSTGYDFGSGR